MRADCFGWVSVGPSLLMWHVHCYSPGVKRTAMLISQETSCRFGQKLRGFST
jgi:hypothetical protein